jgi:hypothetical protein
MVGRYRGAFSERSVFCVHGNKLAPSVLTFSNKTIFSAAPALLFHALVALAMVLSGDIEGLIDFFR